MSNELQLKAWQLCRPLPALTRNDSFEAAMQAFELNRVDALPFVEENSAVGYITRWDVVRKAGGLLAWRNAGPELLEAPCAPMVRRFREVIPRAADGDAVAAAIDRSGDAILPVTGDNGEVLGYVLPMELISSDAGAARLPSVGGMATPFGVYLTTGGISGGVGFWALVSAGVLIGFFAIIAQFASGLALMSADYYASYCRPLSFWLNVSPNYKGDIQSFLFLVIMLVLFRFTRSAGYHAAEHQTVHTLEACEPLTPDRLRAKPRVHPRCGTNMVVLLVMTFALFNFVHSAPPGHWDGEALLAPCLMVLYILRIPIGGFFQQYFTTRPANDRQLASGISAAEELIARYVASDGHRPPAWKQLWSTGIAQVGMGLAARWDPLESTCRHASLSIL